MPKTITVNVEEEVESEFRKQAGRKYGRKKGYLGKAITEAMDEWTRKRMAADLEEEVMAMLKEGIKGRKWKFDRSELYAR